MEIDWHGMRADKAVGDIHWQRSSQYQTGRCCGSTRLDNEIIVEERARAAAVSFLSISHTNRPALV